MSTGNLNCRPGDLAWIVGVAPACRELNDRIVKLKDQPPFTDIYGDVCWELEEILVFRISTAMRHPLTGENFDVGAKVSLGNIEDKYLRPIRGGETHEESTKAIRELHHIHSEVSTC